MELRSVEELMDLLDACRGVPYHRGHGGGRGDLLGHALRTAALLRRSRPSDKELQVAGLVHDIGYRLPADGTVRPGDRAADAVRALLGRRVARLVRLRDAAGRCLAATSGGPGAPAPGTPGGPMSPREAAAFVRDPLAEDAIALAQAADAARAPGMDAGVLEDWRTVLSLVSTAAHARGPVA
ncbi:metal-dependent phosphohydrolase [Streptomyces sp. NPDC059785]|uniref:metal-dependent phosphohydrolase n=1 Tax=unclassified Streptomyces TaxID=2593676 RepID=UPI0036696C0E